MKKHFIKKRLFYLKISFQTKLKENIAILFTKAKYLIEEIF